VAVWVGYDNAGGKRRTLGGGATGGGVAVPIFEPIMEAVWANVAPRTALAPPSPEARRHLACKSIDPESGEIHGRGSGFTECLRVNDKGRIVDAQDRLTSHESAHAARDRDEDDTPRRRRARSEHVYWSRSPWRSQWGWGGGGWGGGGWGGGGWDGGGWGGGWRW
jgi:membrane carboxypeptidase/penicillin-binding protein